jgi:hypothetical protein
MLVLSKGRQRAARILARGVPSREQLSASATRDRAPPEKLLLGPLFPGTVWPQDIGIKVF